MLLSQKKCLLLCDAGGGMAGIPFSGGTSLISLSGGIWNLHSGVLTPTSKRSVHQHVRGTLLSGTRLTRPSVIEAVLWSDINIPTHTHTNTHSRTFKLLPQETTRVLNTCMDHWRGTLKRFLFQKKWYKRKDKGTALSDKWTSHFNRRRDEAWPPLTGVLSHSVQHVVAIVVATSIKKACRNPTPNTDKGPPCLGKHAPLLPSTTGAYIKMDIKQEASATMKDYKQHLQALHIKATLLRHVFFSFRVSDVFILKSLLSSQDLNLISRNLFLATKRRH